MERRRRDGLANARPAGADGKVIDTAGAGDVFHGAYLASFLRNGAARWVDHFEFARAASAFKIQHLGNEAGLPSLDDIAEMQRLYGEELIEI